jgi:hypothetical protein
MFYFSGEPHFDGVKSRHVIANGLLPSAKVHDKATDGACTGAHLPLCTLLAVVKPQP